jgi:ABC-type multidrug transport system fused ATPase/permease subunit
MSGAEASADDDLLSELPTADGNAMLELFTDYVPGYRFQFAVGALASVVARFLELLPSLVLGVAIDSFFREDGGSFAAQVPLVPESWFPAAESSQLLRLLVRLYAIDGGTIREKIAYGAQDIDGRAVASVESGRTPGGSDADGDDGGEEDDTDGRVDLGLPGAEIEAAARTAGAWEFNEELPDGLDWRTESGATREWPGRTGSLPQYGRTKIPRRSCVA